MKKLISLLPIPLLLICLLLAGCTPAPPAPASSSAAFTASTEAPATEAPAPKPVGLVEVTGLEIGEDEGVFGLCCADGLGYIMLQRWDQQAGTSRYRLVTLDPETASVTAEAELDSVPQDAGYDRMKITEGEILLIDEYDERCAVYDRAGAFLGFRDYPVMSREHRGWQNRLLKDDCFWKDTDFASCTDSRGGELSRLVAFYDETDRIHALQEPYENVAAVAGHRVLTRSYGEDSLSYVLWDFDAELRLGETVLTASQVEGARWVNPWGTAIGEDWVLLGAEWSGEAAVIGPEDPPPARTHRLLFWYPDPEAQRPLEQEIWTEERFNEGIAALKTELEALGLTLRLDEAPAPEQTPTTGLAVSESVCETGASLFGQYRILTDLKEFADKLPEGFLRELYSDIPGEEDRDGLHIFIVRNIPGDAAGFACTWSEPMCICFATEEYDRSHLAHEFMHIMDFRIESWFWSKGRDFNGAWWDLSPIYAYNTELTPEQQEVADDYFVSLYARTNSSEDRAETFQALFDCEEPLEETWWYGEHPGVRAKVRFLTEAIRNAFPSVQAAERVWWEKIPPD